MKTYWVNVTWRARVEAESDEVARTAVLEGIAADLGVTTEHLTKVFRVDSQLMSLNAVDLKPAEAEVEHGKFRWKE